MKVNWRDKTMKENLVCVLFGHVGDDFDSGFHVCSRCGLHEWYSSHAPYADSPNISGLEELEAQYDGPQYYKEAYIPYLLDKIGKRIRYIFATKRRKCIDCKRLHKHCDCPPF